MKFIILIIAIFNSTFLLSQITLSQNFESNFFPPTGWQVIKSNPVNNWIRTTSAINGVGSAKVQGAATDQNEQ